MDYEYTIESGSVDPDIHKLHKGGDVVFQTGLGHPVQSRERIDGAFIFKLANNSEMFRIDPDGKVYVRGDFVADDESLYILFREWFAQATIEYKNKAFEVRK